MASEGRHLRPDPVSERLVPEIGPPRPGSNRHAYRVFSRIKPHRAVANVDEGPDITGFQPIHANRFHDRIRDLFLLVGNLHHRNVRRPEQPVNVLGEAKDGGSFATLITADSLERGQPVVKRMGQDMHRGVRPIDELAVHPDLFAWLQHDPIGTIAVPRNSCQRTRRG